MSKRVSMSCSMAVCVEIIPMIRWCMKIIELTHSGRWKPKFRASAISLLWNSRGFAAGVISTQMLLRFYRFYMHVHVVFEDYPQPTQLNCWIWCTGLEFLVWIDFNNYRYKTCLWFYELPPQLLWRCPLGSKKR